MRQEKRRTKAVLDTNIFISSIFWRGNPHKIIGLAIDKRIEIYTSPEILMELENVLKRDFHEEKEFVERQIALILEYSQIVKPTDKVRVVDSDPEDDKIIDCALCSKADYIISGDPHLFNLKEVFGIKILKPKEFIDLLQ